MDDDNDGGTFEGDDVYGGASAMKNPTMTNLTPLVAEIVVTTTVLSSTRMNVDSGGDEFDESDGEDGDDNDGVDDDSEAHPFVYVV